MRRAGTLTPKCVSKVFLDRHTTSKGKKMSTVATDTNGRLPDGTFGPGNRAASGHKRRQRMAELRAAFVQAVTSEAIQEIVATLVRQAKDGCPQSAKLVLDRALGKVTALDSEDPADTSSAADELGPKTEANFAERKRRLLSEIDAGRSISFETLGPVTAENIEQQRAIRMLRLASGH